MDYMLTPISAQGHRQNLDDPPPLTYEAANNFKGGGQADQLYLLLSTSTNAQAHTALARKEHES